MQRSVLGPFEGVRVIHLQDFGGVGNDALALASMDLGTADGRSKALVALSAAIADLSPRVPAGLQVGCVPEELEEDVRTMISERIPSLTFLARAATARRYSAPSRVADSPSTVASASDETQPLTGIEVRVESVDQEGHEFFPWILTRLLGQGYPEDYVRLLVTSGDVAPPLVALDIGCSPGNSPIGFVLQEASDLSLGALYVEEPLRRRGLGSRLLGLMSCAVSDAQSLPAVSHVELDNESSHGLHLKAGWVVDDKALHWLIFAGPPP